MTARRAPTESYAAREARMLADYRAKVIADPNSHADHADEATRLLTAPTPQETADFVGTLDVTALLYLRKYLRGEPVPCTCTRHHEVVLFRMVEWDDDDEPDEVPELAPDTEPAIDEVTPTTPTAEPYSQTLPIKRTIKYPHSV